MPSKRAAARTPLRTGIIGIVLVTCLVLTAFGYADLPVWPQKKRYTAYFTNAAGITAGNDVGIYGYPVGTVTSVELAKRSAKVDFTVDRKLHIGDQSLAAIKTDSVLGRRTLAITPKGSGTSTLIPLGRTTTPYSLNNALQDLGHNVGDLNKPQFAEALQTLTDALHDATPQLRGALDGVTALSRSLNARDEQIAQTLAHANSVSAVLAKRAEQINQLITDGNSLFTQLDARRQAINSLVSGITDLARQLSGFVADNRTEFGPALQKLNLVLDNLNEHREHIAEALARLPHYATALGEVVGSAPGFEANIGGVPPPSAAGLLTDLYFQPGKLPESLADLLRGFLVERTTVRPKSP
ncbi:MCE family protein [Mycolicibacterium sp. CBMA 226]|uniref:MCE family protein n=1 Tax=Mycolicibacterium sp. CBMA 226 TaxID=2606611 RepID=UPI0012DE4DE6|nr:MCE family protein [Mycolicibacterium sp. CBMA 226]MUL74547.1 MCE family protein [Mycolicibacterium sp. CBMA 226]